MDSRMNRFALSRRSLLGAGAGLAATALTRDAFAQAYPSRSVQVIVGWPAGGGADVVARIVQPVMGEKLGQSLVIENMPGATGVIGMRAVARANPDGYTIIAVSNAEVVIAPSVLNDVGFDPIKSFAPIGLMADSPMAFVVPLSSPYNSLKEFLAAAKASPGKLTFGSPGTGGMGHLVGEALALETGVKLTHVAYRGAAPVVNDVLGGHVDSGVVGLLAVRSQYEAGQVKLLAVSTGKRSSMVPNVPTMAESGAPGIDLSLWTAMLAPAGTPAAIVDRLNKALNESLATADIREKLLKVGAEVAAGPPEKLAKVIKDQLQVYEKIARAANLAKQ